MSSLPSVGMTVIPNGVRNLFEFPPFGRDDVRTVISNAVRDLFRISPFGRNDVRAVIPNHAVIPRPPSKKSNSS